MIDVKNIEISGWRAALRGMRNPKDSWSKADSTVEIDSDGNQKIIIGPNDLKLAVSLHKGGPVHSKFKRFIIITMDITAPLYWWKEFDTYKVGTAANSCSTMHRIEYYPFTRDMFSIEHLSEKNLKVLDATIDVLNEEREKYLKIKNDPNISEEEKKDVWWQLIQMLPSTFNQMRTVQFSYENATNMTMWRWNHKQDEWRELIRLFMKFPLAEEIILPSSLEYDEITETFKVVK